ncbi:cobalamin biosynthesis protein [Streptomyces sp. NPDC020875]|uniref:cobalamin biosynthesis protein n=1 Tax=Streptomyces sp. NPDC020875 TaxID=3154898 RepID=UPI0033E53FFA
MEGAVGVVSRAVAAGSPVELRSDTVRPLPPLPPHVAPGAAGAAGVRGVAVLRVTDRLVEPGPVTAVLRPPSLVVGVGAARGVSADEVTGLVLAALRDAGLSPLSVAELVTVDTKAAEPGLLGAAERLGVPLTACPAERLARIPVPHPSEAALRAANTPSVAEAAALAGGGELLVPKRKSTPVGRAAGATCAVVRRVPRGRLAVLGTAPLAPGPLAPHLVAELRRAAFVVGPGRAADGPGRLLRPGTRSLWSESAGERIRTAIARAGAGGAVALLCDDTEDGRHGYEGGGGRPAGAAAPFGAAARLAGAVTAAVAADEGAADIDLVVVPGPFGAYVPRGTGFGPGREPGQRRASADTPKTLGTPKTPVALGTPRTPGPEHVVIGLADPYAPSAPVSERLRAAAATDAVITLYGPHRPGGLAGTWISALSVLAEHRPPETPVMIVRNSSRPHDSGRLTTLGRVDPARVDMMTVVTVGNTATRTIAGPAVTPRGHRWQS